MWNRSLLLVGVLLWLALSLPDANAQGTRSDYDRAAQLSVLTRDKVFKPAVRPCWLTGNQRFWYRNDLGKGTREFVLVDAAAGERRSAFDHSRLATALGKALKKEITAERLPFDEIGFDDPRTTLRFSVGGKRWECLLASYELRELGPEDSAIVGRGTDSTSLCLNRITHARVGPLACHHRPQGNCHRIRDHQ